MMISYGKLSRRYFGEEALLYDDLRDYRAVASGETIVLALDYKHYFEIHDELPDLRRRWMFPSKADGLQP